MQSFEAACQFSKNVRPNEAGLLFHFLTHPLPLPEQAGASGGGAKNHTVFVLRVKKFFFFFLAAALSFGGAKNHTLFDLRVKMFFIFLFLGRRTFVWRSEESYSFQSSRQDVFSFFLLDAAGLSLATE